MNLCLNARDAMPEGGRLRLATAVLDLREGDVSGYPWAKRGRYLAVVITDTGSGIAPEIVDRIFEPLFTTKPEGKGTGLGLSVAYAIVRQHGGILRCQSSPDGTRFEVLLPIEPETATKV